jgi:transcriptional regulator with XRE-family HTH domain
MKIDSQLSFQSVYHVFAENLQALVSHRGTIAKACQELDINRQQFNKYLNGSVLPNEVTMAKLLGYFHVELHEFFRKQKSITPKHYSDSSSDIFKNEMIKLSINQIIGQGSDCKLREGLYLAYAPWPLYDDYCMRSLLVVRRVEGMLLFTRLTRINQIGANLPNYKSRTQHGVVTQYKNLITMMGHEPRQGHSKIMLSFVLDDLNPTNCMPGLGCSNTPSGQPISSRIALHYQGPSTEWRKYYKTSGMLRADDASIRKDVAPFVANQLDRKVALLLAFDVFDSLLPS